MRLSVVTPWSHAVLTVGAIKPLLGITHDHLDDKILRNARSAVSLVEDAGRVCLFTQTRRIAFDREDDFDSIQEKAVLYKGPVASIAMVESRARGAAPTTLDSELYYLDKGPVSRVEWKENFWTTVGDNGIVSVNYVCGCPDLDTLALEHPALLEAFVSVLQMSFDTDLLAEKAVPDAVHELLQPYWTSPTYH